MPRVANVPMPDGSTYRLPALLTRGDRNAKLAKSADSTLIMGLTLAPHREAGLGNLCPHASPGCVALCLNVSGRSNGDHDIARAIRTARVARARLYHQDRCLFLDMLRRELWTAVRRAGLLGLPLAFRPNVTSDIDWPRVHRELIEEFSSVQWYGYTKNPAAYTRFLAGLYPRNYHLTFSRSERNESKCLDFLRAGGHVAVPFAVKYTSTSARPLPATWEGFPVIDGDIDDRRYLDPSGPVVVGLRAKGRARRNAMSGFIVKV